MLDYVDFRKAMEFAITASTPAFDEKGIAADDSWLPGTLGRSLVSFRLDPLAGAQSQEGPVHPCDYDLAQRAVSVVLERDEAEGLVDGRDRARLAQALNRLDRFGSSSFPSRTSALPTMRTSRAP
jgi:hypothetical protein